METPTTKAPVRTIPTSVHVWLWIFISVWVISFLLPAVSIMEQRPGRGWEVAWSALVLFFVPVKGAWMIFIPGIWLVWMNLFMLIAPFELKQLEGGEGRIYAVLFSIGTAATIVIAYFPLSGATGLHVGFYFWAGSLIAAAGLFVRNLWPYQLARLPTPCLMGLLLALPVYRGEVQFLPTPLKLALKARLPEAPHGRGTTIGLLDSSPNPSLMGSSVIFTATTSAADGSIPSGTVYFVERKIAIGKVHTTGGVAALSISALKAGEHLITANFAGDATTDYLGSTSHELIQLVNDPNDVETRTSVTLVERHLEQPPGHIGFTVKVRVIAIGSTTPPITAGEVVLFMHGLGTALTLDHDGEATLTAVLPVTGWHGYQVRAIYNGGHGYQASLSTLTLQ